MREIRGRKISMVLQDPQTSLNPVFSIGDQLREAILRRRKAPRAEVMQEAVTALRRVEIAAPEQRIAQYPHQMSGGMKQRVVGAIAISGQPGGADRRRADHRARCHDPARSTSSC